VERDVAAPVDRVLSKEQTTNADERDDKATERYKDTKVVVVNFVVTFIVTLLHLLQLCNIFYKSILS